MPVIDGHRASIRTSDADQSELIGKQVWINVKDDDDLWVLGTGVVCSIAGLSSRNSLFLVMVSVAPRSH